MLKFYNYMPIIIYPYSVDVNRLYNSSLQRSLISGRVLECKTEYGISKKMENIEKGFKDLLKLTEKKHRDFKKENF